jgi:hypothetical protein
VETKGAIEEKQPAEVREAGIHWTAQPGGEGRLQVAAHSVLLEQRANVVGVAGARGRDVVAAAGEGEASEGQGQESVHGGLDSARSVPATQPPGDP